MFAVPQLVCCSVPRRTYAEATAQLIFHPSPHWSQQNVFVSQGPLQGKPEIALYVRFQRWRDTDRRCWSFLQVLSFVIKKDLCLQDIRRYLKMKMYFRTFWQWSLIPFGPFWYKVSSFVSQVWLLGVFKVVSHGKSAAVMWNPLNDYCEGSHQAATSVIMACLLAMIETGHCSLNFLWGVVSERAAAEKSVQPCLPPEMYSPWLFQRVQPVCCHPQPWLSTHAELIGDTAQWAGAKHVYSSMQQYNAALLLRTHWSKVNEQIMGKSNACSKPVASLLHLCFSYFPSPQWSQRPKSAAAQGVSTW